MPVPVPDNCLTHYSFACTWCGDCCHGQQSVALNGEDLDLLALHLGFSETGALFHHGYVEARRDGNSHWRPFIRFRKRPLRMCPFIQNHLEENGKALGFCQLHPKSKPLVCHLAPLGRILDMEDASEVWQVHAPAPGCPGMGIGVPRLISDDLAVWRQRLANEAIFFGELELSSPGCSTAEQAALQLFSWRVPNADHRLPHT